MKDFKGQTFLFLGKSGAGKDCQANRLISFLESKKFNVLRVSTGDLGRELAKENSLMGNWIRNILNKGGFFPFWAQAGLWFGFLQDRLKKDTVTVFPSSPRRLEEAKALDELMVNLNRSLPIPIYLDISDKESERRLLERGREDDKPAAIKKRLENFHIAVMPIVKNYNHRVIKVDGFGAKEEVQERLFKLLSERL